MKYTGDRKNQLCRKCDRKVTLVRCPNCQGHGGGMTTQCGVCRNTGYVCEAQKGDRNHQP